MWVFSGKRKPGESDHSQIYPADFVQKHPQDHREQFAATLVDAYKTSNPATTVTRYSVFLEPGQIGSTTPHDHFHAMVLTDKSIRFTGVANALREKGIYASASTHEGYHSGFRYCWQPGSKKTLSDLDPTPFLPPEHPPPEVALRRPRTAAATKGRKATKPAKEAKSRRYSLGELKTLVRRENVRTVADLMLRAQRIPELEVFCLAHRKDLQKYVDTVWEISAAGDTVAEELRVARRMGMTRLELLSEAATALQCVCAGRYIPAYLAITEMQGVGGLLERAIIHALDVGRGKDSNLYLHGDADCGKSFVLDPLRLVYTSALTNPAPNERFGLENIHGKEIVLLHDFKGDELYCPWGNTLCWLEGKPVGLEVKGGGSFEYSGTAPVFFASGTTFRRIEKGLENVTETAMFGTRVRYIHFRISMEKSAVDRTLVSCGRCYAAHLAAYIGRAAA